MIRPVLNQQSQRATPRPGSRSDAYVRRGRWRTAAVAQRPVFARWSRFRPRRVADAEGTDRGCSTVCRQFVFVLRGADPASLARRLLPVAKVALEEGRRS